MSGRLSIVLVYVRMAMPPWAVRHIMTLIACALAGVMALCPAARGDELAEVKAQLAGLESEYALLRAENAAFTPEAAPAALRSAGGNATVRIGGEINTDYVYVFRDKSQQKSVDWYSSGGWHLRNSNLRFTFDTSPDVRMVIKLDLSETQYYLQNQILEEAKIIWNRVGGGPFSIIFGKGEVPYGQDRTLGIIQSYHHTEGSYSAEGPTILNGPLPGQHFDSPDALSPVFHPGEIDRVIHAGISFDWDDVLRLEFAVFQPTDWAQPGLNNATLNDFGLQSFCARLWWNVPVEGMTVQISGVRQHIQNRSDRRFGAHGVRDQYAASAGLDWVLPQMPLEVFAEYQRGWDWNYTAGYNTHTVSVGALYDLTNRLRVGGVVEWLHIDNRGSRINYNKFVAHTRYNFTESMHTIAEYGCELYNFGSTTAHMFAIRSGVRF